MTTSEYIIYLRRCKLSICGKDTKDYLCKTSRTLLYYHGGHKPIPHHVANLLRQRIILMELGVSDPAIRSTDKTRRA